MKSLFALAAVAAFCVAPVYADCSYPPPPEHLPDGNTSTKDEMIAGQKAVKDYDKAINAYMACIQLEHDDAISKAGDKLTKEQEEAMKKFAEAMDYKA